MQSLHVYPVKSCRAIDVTAWPLDEHGLRHDRRFCIVGPTGVIVTQREVPALAQVATALEGEHVILSQVGRDPLRVGLIDEGGPPITVHIWRDQVLGQAVGVEADGWLSTLCGEPVRLVRFSDAVRREVDPRYAPGFATQFADGYPILIAAQASLDALNARLPSPLPMDRFRANIVVEGSPAFAEDEWGEVAIGAAAIRVVKPCARCVVVTTDQGSGARGTEPLRTLAAFRRRDNGVMFGQNAVVTRTGEIGVGDAITI